ncbi:MAG TPA: histidine kinase, partial [Blastocatellia bacterium]|nr:histidine kinase [Blastocatellia bacterium]
MFWTLQICGWAAFACAMFLATAVVLPVRVAALEKVIFTLIGMISSLLLRAIYRRFYKKNLSVFWILVLSTICAYVAAMLWTGSYSLTVEFIRASNQNRSAVIDNWQRLFNGGLYHSFILLAWSVLYFGIKHYLELQEQTQRTLKAEALAQQAQLQALRYQINPHFLFNTLNAISTLVAQHENAAANRMIARLSDFLRLTLESSGEPEVTLDDELDFARRYLEIEQVRLGERLKVKFKIAPE